MPTWVSHTLATDGVDWLRGTDGFEWIGGLRGDDRIDARGGNDHIYGDHPQGPGPGDTPGNNWISAGAGDDWVQAGSGADTVLGGPGNDRIFGWGGAQRGSPYEWIGLDLGDVLSGGIGHDFLNGGGGVDWLDGGHGNDTIMGGDTDAPDILVGGPGRDNFQGVMRSFGDARDTILDFEPGRDIIYAGTNTAFRGTEPFEPALEIAQVRYDIVDDAGTAVAQMWDWISPDYGYGVVGEVIVLNVGHLGPSAFGL